MFALLWRGVCCVLGMILDDLLSLIFAWSNVLVRDSSVIAVNLHACMFVQHVCFDGKPHTSKRRSVFSARPSKAWHRHHRVRKKAREGRDQSLSKWLSAILDLDYVGSPPWCRLQDHGSTGFSKPNLTTILGKKLMMAEILFKYSFKFVQFGFTLKKIKIVNICSFNLCECVFL